MQSDSVKNVSLAGLLGVGSPIDGVKAAKGKADDVKTFTEELKKVVAAAELAETASLVGGSTNVAAAVATDAGYTIVAEENAETPTVNEDPAETDEMAGIKDMFMLIPQEDKIRVGNELLTQSLKRIAAILGLPDEGDANAAFEFDPADIEQLAAIMSYLDLTIKMANDRIDVSANAESANMAMAAYGMESPIAHIEPEENAAELSEFAAALRTEKFRMDMAFRLIGVSGMIADKMAENSEAGVATGIPQAVNPADLGMSVSDTVSAFSNLIREELASSADRVRQVVRGQAELTDIERAAVELGTVKSEILKAALNKTNPTVGKTIFDGGADVKAGINKANVVNTDVNADKTNVKADVNATINTANVNTGINKNNVNANVNIGINKTGVKADVNPDVNVKAAVNKTINPDDDTVNVVKTGIDTKANVAVKANVNIDNVNAEAKPDINTANVKADVNTTVNTTINKTVDTDVNPEAKAKPDIKTANVKPDVNTTVNKTVDTNVNTEAKAKPDINTANVKADVNAAVNKTVDTDVNTEAKAKPDVKTANVKTDVNTTVNKTVDTNVNPEAKAKPDVKTANVKADVNPTVNKTVDTDVKTEAKVKADVNTVNTEAKSDVKTANVKADVNTNADIDTDVSVNKNVNNNADVNVDTDTAKVNTNNVKTDVNTANVKADVNTNVNTTINTEAKAEVNTVNVNKADINTEINVNTDGNTDTVETVETKADVNNTVAAKVKTADVDKDVNTDNKTDVNPEAKASEKAEKRTTDLPISAHDSASRRRRSSVESANRLASMSAERAAGAKASSAGDSAALPLSVMALAHGRKAAKSVESGEAKKAAAEPQAQGQTQSQIHGQAKSQAKNAVADGEATELPVSVMESSENKPAAKKSNVDPKSGANATGKSAAKSVASAINAAMEAVNAKTETAAANKAADDALVAKLKQTVETASLIKNKGGKASSSESVVKSPASLKTASSANESISANGVESDSDADLLFDNEETSDGGTGSVESTSHRSTAAARHAEKADAPALSQDDRFEVIRQISEKLNNAVRSGANEIRMVLRPESLGEMRMSIRVQGDVVFARMQVENKQVKSIVESNLQSLKDSLLKQNLEFGAIDVEVGTNNEGDKSPRQLWEEMADRAEQRSGFRENNGVSSSEISGGSENFVSAPLGSDTGRRFGENTFEYFA